MQNDGKYNMIQHWFLLSFYTDIMLIEDQGTKRLVHKPVFFFFFQDLAFYCSLLSYFGPLVPRVLSPTIDYLT